MHLIRSFALLLLGVLGPALPATVHGEEAPAFTLVSAGQAPRRILRYAPAAGLREQSEVVVDMDMALPASGGEPARQAQARTRAVREHVVTKPGPGGELTYEARFLAFGMDAAQEAAHPEVIDLARARLPRVRATGMVPAAGGMDDLTTDLPESPTNVEDATLLGLSKLLRLDLPELPDQPLGRGAHWQVRSDGVMHGVVVTRTVDFRVVRLRGQEVTLTIRSRLDDRATEPRLRTGNDGTEEHVARIAFQLEGDFVLALDRAVPRKGRMAVEVTMEVAEAPGAPVAKSVSKTVVTTRAPHR